MTITVDKKAEKEKRDVALSSVFAAVFLTIFKIVVGVLTNSLGILSEALHSGLDLVAAGVTFFAVRFSDQPPDQEHRYGHGKIESFAALIETLLLLATCVWIIYEAIERLLAPVHVEANIWSFVVMGTSIVVDISRSRALMRVAKKYKSQALEADALHFSTDVWSSSVVIFGLFVVWLARWLEPRFGIDVNWLYRADSIAALGVSGIVIWVSYQLGKRTIDVLLDRASPETVERIENVIRQTAGVSQVKRLRVRHSGPATFVDMTLEVGRSASFEEAHQTAVNIEESIQSLIPHSDVMVRIEPVVEDEASLVEQVWSAAARQGVSVHGVRAHDIRGQMHLEMHVEVPDTLTLGEAHATVSAFEDLLRSEITSLRDVVTHIEPVGDEAVRRFSVREGSHVVREVLLELANEVQGIRNVHRIETRREGNEISLSFHCHINPSLSISEAHRLTEMFEAQLRSRLSGIGRVVIHAEPWVDPENTAEPDADPRAEAGGHL